jgi:hypothetical protein
MLSSLKLFEFLSIVTPIKIENQREKSLSREKTENICVIEEERERDTSQIFKMGNIFAIDLMNAFC